MEGTGGGSLGRAEQANCTLLAASRFLVVVMGGTPGGSGSQPVPHCTCAGQPMGQEGGKSCPPCRVRAPRVLEWVLPHPPQGHTAQDLSTHTGRFHHVLLWLWFLGAVWWAFCLTGDSALETEGAGCTFTFFWSICEGQSLVLGRCVHVHMRSGHSSC